MKGEIEGHEHDCQKGWNSGIPTGKDPVNFHRTGVFPTLVAFYNGCFYYSFNKAIAHIRQSGIAIQTRFGLHLDNTVLQKFLFVFIQSQLIG